MLCVFEVAHQKQSHRSTKPELRKCVLEMTLCCPREFSDQQDSFQLEIPISLSKFSVTDKSVWYFNIMIYLVLFFYILSLEKSCRVLHSLLCIICPSHTMTRVGSSGFSRPKPCLTYNKSHLGRMCISLVIAFFASTQILGIE